MSDAELPKSNKHRHLHIGALILAIAIILLLFKVNLEKAINSPQFNKNVAYIEKEGSLLFLKLKGFFSIGNSFKIDQSIFESKIQPDKVKDYFGVPSDDTVNRWSSPTGN